MKCLVKGGRHVNGKIECNACRKQYETIEEAKAADCEPAPVAKVWRPEARLFME